MAFFFCVGFLYDDKYNNTLHIFLGKRIWGIAKLYSLYNAIFVLLHNALITIGIIDADIYDFNDILINLASGTIMQTNEAMLGAFWFLPVLFIACFLFCLPIYLIEEKFNVLKKVKLCSYALCIIVFAIAGIYMNYQEFYLTYHVQTSFLAVPIMYLGWIIKKNIKNIEKYVCWQGAIVSAIILTITVYSNITVELSANRLGNIWLFYPITIIGIYFCLCLSELTTRINVFYNAIKFIGRYSFHFMALHFLVFKILDKFVALYKGDSRSISCEFPHSYNLGVGYAFMAIFTISALIYARLQFRDMQTIFGKVKHRICIIKK